MSDSRLFAPEVHNSIGSDVAGRATTGISVYNPGDADVEITARYRGLPFGTCENTSFQQRATVPSRSSVILYHGTGYTLQGQVNPLPAGCIASAVLEASGGPVVAVVNDLKRGGHTGGSSAAYRAVPQFDTASAIHVPLIRHQHGSQHMMTAILVMNAGEATANTMLTLRDGRGRQVACDVGCSRTVSRGAVFSWYGSDFAPLGPDAFGSGTILSDQPLAVVVNEIARSGAVDSAAYNGQPCHPERRGERLGFPLLADPRG
jgi:hypothetical protein